MSEFYQAQLESSKSGLLSGEELDRVRPLLSADLYARYQRAVRSLEEWTRANPDDPEERIFNKPPCGDGGNYFDSLGEWPDVRSDSDDPKGHVETAGAERQTDGSWRVSVHFWYETTPRVEWTDVAVALEERGTFVIDDVIYPGGAFNRDGTLSKLLGDCVHELRVAKSDGPPN